jgi:hypothetical protein
VTGAGRVAPDQDVLAVAQVVGDLRQRQIQHCDVVRGGVGARIPWSEQAGQRFARRIEEALCRAADYAALRAESVEQQAFCCWKRGIIRLWGIHLTDVRLAPYVRIRQTTVDGLSDNARQGRFAAGRCTLAGRPRLSGGVRGVGSRSGFAMRAR